MKRTPLQTGDANVPRELSQLRERPLMKWLTTSEELDAIAKRRVLMILSVLSGELPVTQAIAQAGITRPLYYVLERRAVEAMLLAVMPGAEMPGSQNLTSQGKIRHLEAQIKKLEREKRRIHRLLFLTRKVLGSGPYKTKSGGPRTMRGKKISSKPASIPSGKPTSKRSAKPKKASPSGETSIPNKDGAAEQSPGNES